MSRPAADLTGASEERSDRHDPSAGADRTLLRFITCGSVDDGKSTLIGRLLFETDAVFDDQMEALERDSRKFGTTGGELDFALLVDGLSAEREQGITIDVAYRYFSARGRAFIIADTPGHEQYTRNMATGASQAELAVILVDARKGILPQTRRHSFITSMVGIKSVVVAVNKMDLVGFSQEVFEAIRRDYEALLPALGFTDVVFIPLSAKQGDNLAERSARTPWYDGPTLLDHLARVRPETLDEADAPFRLPVQWVNRPNLDFRGFSGTVASGRIAVGDAVRIVPSGLRTTVSRILSPGGDSAEASGGEAVTLVLADEIDCSRGDVIAAADGAPEIADQFQVKLIWTDETALLPGRGYWMKLATRTVTASVQAPDHLVDMHSFAQLSARTLGLNDIGVCQLYTDQPLAFESYAASRVLGGFLLIDKVTNATVALGMINFALRRSQNVHWQSIEITREAHAVQKNQRPVVLWFTGLSGSGKSTIANTVERKLHALGRHSFLLDGDNVRHGLNKDLGFTAADRIENIRRVGEVARLMADAGLIVLAAFISPFRAERQLVRSMLPEGEFVEIFVDTPLAVAEKRDVKGLYRKARAGDLKNFTGVDSPYEPPDEPEIRIDTTQATPEEAADLIIRRLFPSPGRHR